MSLHLIKLCVGIEDVEHLIHVHNSRKMAAKNTGRDDFIRHITRNKPRRAQELINGGSLYWVIRRTITVRQPILGIESFEKENGLPACAILLADQYIRTVPRRFRPFQGWRYISGKDVPFDLDQDCSGKKEELPPEMSAELRELGLI